MKELRIVTFRGTLEIPRPQFRTAADIVWAYIRAKVPIKSHIILGGNRMFDRMDESIFGFDVNCDGKADSFDDLIIMDIIDEDEKRSSGIGVDGETMPGWK